MDDKNKTIELKVPLSAQTFAELKGIMEKLIAASQLPQGVSLEMFTQMILQNYVQSTKAMEKMGGDFLAGFKDKLESALGGLSGSTENIYKAMMEGFSGAFNKPEKEKTAEDKKPGSTAADSDKIKKS